MPKQHRPASPVRSAALSRRALLAGTATSLMATGAFAESAAARVTEAQRLARFAHDISFDKLPASTVAAVKRLVLDTLGCALGAVGSEPAKIAEATVTPLGANARGATIIGSGEHVSAEAASFVNGTQVRFLDFLDVYFTKDVCHPSENIPPALACVEEMGGSGRDAIEAIVVGYEAEARLCDVLAFPSINMHPASAAGFVVPLVAGKVWRQTPEQLAHGCVLGGARHMTLNSLLAGDLSMAKALAYALSGAEGITAARLAGAGFTGPLASFEWLFNKVAGQARIDHFAARDERLARRTREPEALSDPVRPAGAGRGRGRALRQAERQARPDRRHRGNDAAVAARQYRRPGEVQAGQPRDRRPQPSGMRRDGARRRQAHRPAVRARSFP